MIQLIVIAFLIAISLFYIIRTLKQDMNCKNACLNCHKKNKKKIR